MHNFLNIFKHKRGINRAIRTMLLVSGLYMFVWGMFGPIYALFVQEIGGDVSTAANAYAVYWLVAGVLTFVAGKWEDKMKETELAIVLSQFIAGGAYVLYYFTSTISMLYMTLIVLGVAQAIFWPAFHSVYTKHVDGQRSAWQWSFYDGSGYIIPAISAAIGGWIVKSYGFDIVFVIMAVLSFMCGLFILLLPRKIL